MSSRAEERLGLSGEAGPRVDGYVVAGGDPAGLMARGNHAFPAVEPGQPADGAAPLLGSAELTATRAYAFDCEASSVDEVIAGAARALQLYGFAVLDHVVPRAEVAAVAHEISDGMDAALAAAPPPQRVGAGGVAQSRHDVVLQPLYQRHVCHPAVVGLARTALDAHVRLAQWSRRNIPSDAQMPAVQPGGFGPVEGRGEFMREYHMDWPHDMEKGSNGNIRQPFPDVCMALSMVWYLTDVGPASGGTFVVPQSHRDPRNPRSPHDGMCVTAPIPGELQVSAPAGSVFVQDTRTWHSTACYNTSGRVRVSANNRWVPWWLNAAMGPNAARCLTPAELGALPAALQPLMRHLCPELVDEVAQPVLDRAAAAWEVNKAGFERIGEPALERANAHIRPVGKL